MGSIEIIVRLSYFLTVAAMEWCDVCDNASESITLCMCFVFYKSTSLRAGWKCFGRKASQQSGIIQVMPLNHSVLWIYECSAYA